MRRLLLLTLALSTVACSAKTPPATAGGGPAFPGAVSPDPSGAGGSSGSGAGTRVVPPPPPIQPNPGMVTSTPVGASVEAINDNSPLKPVFFQYDSDTLDADARRILAGNADVLRANPSWAITIEGHCDERGTPEYNLALGDRRALAVRDYLVSLGLASERLQTVSYGKEFPFDSGHGESAWALNRRAHFLLTAK